VNYRSHDASSADNKQQNVMFKSGCINWDSSFRTNWDSSADNTQQHSIESIGLVLAKNLYCACQGFTHQGHYHFLALKSPHARTMAPDGRAPDELCDMRGDRSRQMLAQ
jgi:hypothetical protein